MQFDRLALVATTFLWLIAPARAEQISDEPLGAAPATIEPGLVQDPALQPPPIPAGVDPAAAGALTAERVERLLREVEQKPELDADSRKLAADAYRTALADLQRAAEYAARAEAFGRDAVGVNHRVEQLKHQLEDVKAKEPVTAPDSTLADLEQAVAKIELQLATQKSAQAAAEAESQNRSNRRKEIRARIVAIQEGVSALMTQTPSPDLNAAVAAAKGVEMTARRKMLEAEAPALESELTKYDAEDAADLVRLQSDLAAKQTALTERQLQELREEIKKARDAAAEESVRKARLEAIVAAPALKHLAERNQQLAETAQTISQQRSGVERDLKAAKEAFETLDRQFKQVKSKIETVGLTSSVGAQLRRQRATLPDVQQRRLAITERSATIDEVQYQLIEYEDERQMLGDTDAVVATILAEAPPRDGVGVAFLEEAARELLDRKREYLGSLARAYNAYFTALVDLDFADQQVVSLTEQYGKFIDERVLWIRSGRMMTHEQVLDPADGWLLNPKKWMEISLTLAGDARGRPWLYVVFLGLFGALVARGARLRRELNEAGEAAARANCRTLEPTLRAIALTVLVSIAWPGIVALLSWRLRAAADGGALSAAVANGLFSACLIWAPLEFIRQVCRPRGLAEAHFAWPPAVAQSLRRRLRWITLLGLPFAFLAATLHLSNPTPGHDALERCCFIVGMMVLTIFVFRLLSSNGLLREHIAYHQGGWVDRLSHLWPWLAVIPPLALLGLAFAGYYYTAQVLAWRLFATMCFLVALWLVRDFLLRMLLLRRRNLSIQQAKQRAATATAAVEPEAGGAAVVAGIVASSQQSDLSAHNQQTRRLLGAGVFASCIVGLWLIWVQVLPALGMLDKYPLWSTSVATAQAATASPPLPGAAQIATKTEAGDHATPEKNTVTLSDLGLAVLVTFVTFVLFRNGPGLLEISLLQKLPLDASVRYAITTLASYAIVMIGTILACSTIGLRWSQVQWLATALTFGLAFGLQEMFANFVAGLIILLERPIRVGDVVTVDEITGVVSRIRIRATSITNWDRKEYVVPNKEFITGRLLNWTLTDKVNRVVVNVGVAYGTDTDRVQELLLRVAAENPLVLKDPAPVASFEGFGDNSLNFVLRTYLAVLDHRLQVTHELHTAINNAFNAEGIEIAFPQRDLHIRTAPEVLAVALNKGNVTQKPKQEPKKDAA